MKTTEFNFKAPPYRVTVKRVQGFVDASLDCDGVSISIPQYEDYSEVTVDVPSIGVSGETATVTSDGFFFRARVGGKFRPVIVKAQPGDIEAVNEACCEIIDPAAKARHDAAEEAERKAEERYKSHVMMMRETMTD